MTPTEKAKALVQKIVNTKYPCEAVWVQNSVIELIAEAFTEVRREAFEEAAMASENWGEHPGRAIAEMIRAMKEYEQTDKIRTAAEEGR